MCIRDRWQKDWHIRPCHKFRIHPAGLLKERAAQLIFADAKTFGDAGQIPDRIDGRFRDCDVTRRAHDLAIDGEKFLCHQVAEIRQCQPRLGNRDTGPDIDAFGDFRTEILGDAMAPWIERDNARGLRPLRKRADIDDRRGVGQIGARNRIECAGGNRERAIKRISCLLYTSPSPRD